MTPAEGKALEQGYGGGSGGSAAVRKRRRPPPPRREPERTAAPAPARAQEAAKPAAGGGGGKTARIVRTEAGARRYGVQVGQPYTDGKMPGRGDKGPKVTDAKEKLAAIGLFKDLGKEGIQSDVFGPRLEEAVRAFQKEQGLAVTGRLDAATERRLTRVAPGGDPKDGKLGKDKDSGSGGGSSSAAGGGRESTGSGDRSSAGKDGDGGKVTVKKGDTLWAIAERELGDGNRWKEIRDASGLGKDFDPTKLQPGVKLTIPGKAPTEGVGEAPGRGGAGSGRGAGSSKPMSREEVRSALQALPQAVRDDVLRRARQLLAKQLRKG